MLKTVGVVKCTLEKRILLYFSAVVLYVWLSGKYVPVFINAQSTLQVFPPLDLMQVYEKEPSNVSLGLVWQDSRRAGGVSSASLLSASAPFIRKRAEEGCCRGRE